MRRIGALAVFLLAAAGPAAASPAQQGLTGWSEMRTPELTTAPTAYLTERYARMIPGMGHRNLITLGYVDSYGAKVEWGVLLPLASSDAGTGLNQPRAMAKWRMLDATYVDISATADLLLPAGIGYSDTGTGQFGLAGGVQLLVEQAGVQVALSGNFERADYCLGCSRPAPLAKDMRFAARGVDAALGLRVPVEEFAVVAELHERWVTGNHFGISVDDGDLYASVGGEIPVVENVAAKVFVGSGFTDSKNTDLFGGFTVGYRIP